MLRSGSRPPARRRSASRFGRSVRRGLAGLVGRGRLKGEVLAVGELLVSTVGLVRGCDDDPSTPWRRQASSSNQVPRTLASKLGSGEDAAMPTIVWAARWKTVPAPCSASARSTVSPPLVGRPPPRPPRPRSRAEGGGGAPLAGSAVEGDDRSPRSSSALQSQAPTNPRPPVTSELAGAGPGGVPLPNGPRRSPVAPEVVQGHRVLVGVHAVPEARMAEAVELAVGRQPRGARAPGCWSPACNRALRARSRRTRR